MDPFYSKKQSGVKRKNTEEIEFFLFKKKKEKKMKIDETTDESSEANKNRLRPPATTGSSR